MHTKQRRVFATALLAVLRGTSDIMGTPDAYSTALKLDEKNWFEYLEIGRAHLCWVYLAASSSVKVAQAVQNAMQQAASVLG